MSAPQRTPSAEANPARPAVTGGTGTSIIRQDRIDISDQAGGGDDPATGMTPRERLDAYAARFLDRLDHLMSKEGLSAEQQAALKEAKAEFQQNIERFDDAFLDGARSRDGIGPALKNIVSALRESVHAALGGVHE